MKMMYKLNILLSIWVIAIVIPLLFVTCEKDKDEPTGNNKAELSEIASDTILYTSAFFSAKVNSTGGHSIADHGFCYSSESMPDLNDSVKSLGSLAGKGTFNALIDNLESNTKYYIRAYIRITAGTIYSQEVAFTTLKTGRPLMVSDSVFSITPYGATLSGTIVSDSGLAIVARGFCWGTQPQPNLSDSSKHSLTNQNNFIESIGNLTIATTYYFRSFATNGAGTSYGNEISFTTSAVTPTVNIQNITSITTTYAACGGEVTSDGGASIIGCGLCWSTSEYPTIFGSYTLDGSGIGPFVSNIYGLTPSTTYYVRAYATNSAGTAYSIQKSFVTSSIPTLPIVTTSEIANITTSYALGGGLVLSDGGSSVVTRGVCWSTTENPNVFGLHTTDGNGIGSFTSDLTGLTEGTVYYARAYASNSIGTSYGNQVSFTTADIHTIPSLSTSAISSITSSTAVSGGNVTSTGGDAVTARGVCWSISPNPTIASNHTIDSSGSGTFISNLSGLIASTMYYVRAYATNINGTAYGEQVAFVTSDPPVLPTLITSSVSSVTTNSAECGGNISHDGGASVTARGVCWNLTQNPTISDLHTSDGAGTGSFSSYITGLNAGTTYYVRAYATNSAGTAYGGQQTFTTTSTITIPTVTTATATEVTATTATSGGNVTNSGGATVTVRGICWSTSQNPTIFGNHTNDGSGTGTFISLLSGLSPLTTYYIRAYATNSAGTAYGNQESFTTTIIITIPTVTTSSVSGITANSAISGGNVTASGGANVTERGVCWSTSQNPTLNDGFTIDGSGTGSFISSITGLVPSSTYFVRAYATNSQGTAYGNQQSFVTDADITLPSVATSPVTEITSSTATSGGDVTNSGGANVTARGVCWSTIQSPTLSDYFTSDGSGTGAFVSNITGLNPSTTYYVRAYATNSVGTAYGNEESFTTATAWFVCGTFTLTDIDGNIYNTVQIGTQCWMKENLKTSKYNNGSDITYIGNEITGEWQYAINGAFTYYDNNIYWKDLYGALYNWRAVASSNGLCPEGWHIPTINEWIQTSDFLGGISVSGGKMKSTLTEPLDHPRWDLPNTGATNESSFTGLPSGSRHNGEFYEGLGNQARIWSCSNINSEEAWYFWLMSSNDDLTQGSAPINTGFSVRCIMSSTSGQKSK